MADVFRSGKIGGVGSLLQAGIIAWVKGLAHAFADKRDGIERKEHHKQRRQDEPPLADIFAQALVNQFSPTGCGRAQPKAEEV